MKRPKIVNFDMETTGVSITSDFKVLAYMIQGESETHFIDDRHSAVEELGKLLEEGYILCGHNILCFDLPRLCHWDAIGDFEEYLLKNPTQIIDTLVLNRIWNGTEVSSMADIWEKIKVLYPEYPQNKFEIEDFSKASQEDLERRVRDDVLIQEAITKHLLQDGLPENWKNFSRFFPYIIRMSAGGVPIQLDNNKIKELSKKTKMHQEAMQDKLGVTIKKTKKGLQRIKVNLNSPKQVSEALEKKSYILPQTRTGNPTLAKTKKHEILRDIPILDDYYKYKEGMSLLSYLTGDGKKSIPSKIINGSIYPGFHLCRQSTYRSSFTSPPIFQLDKRLRDFVGHPNYYWVSIDLVSLELAMAGYIFKILFDDWSLWEEVKNQDDSKQITIDCFGDLFINIPEEEKRSVAKTIFYACQYGAGIDVVLQNLRLPVTETNWEKCREAYDKRFSGITALNQFYSGVADGEPVKNVYGWTVTKEGHKLPNYVIQSSGAVYAYIYFGLLDSLLSKGKVYFTPSVFSHDEVNYLVHKNWMSVDALKELVEEVLEGCNKSFTRETGLDLVTTGSVGVGNNWKEAK